MTPLAKATSGAPPRPVLRILYRYVLAEVLSPTLLAFSLYTFIMLMNQLFVLADYAQRFGVPISALGSLFLLQLPHVVVLTLPMSLLVGFLVAAARLASDSELIALTASGVSFTALLRPVLHIALAFSLITGWLLYDFMPRSNHQISQRIYEIFRDNILENVRSGEFNQRLMTGFTMFVSEVASEKAKNDVWRGVLIEEAQHAESGDRRRREVSFAREVRPRLDEEARELELVLSGVTVISWRPDGDGRYEVRSIDRYVKRLPPPPLTRKPSDSNEGAGTVREQTVPELFAHLASLRPEAEFDLRLTRLEIHKRFAIPFACFVFAFLGLGLGATARNSGWAFGFVASLGIILVYYQLFYLGERLAVNGAVSPWLSMWAGNLLFGVLGLWLFSRRARGQRFRVDLFLGRWLRHPRSLSRRLAARLQTGSGRAPVAATTRSGRRALPSILDRYVLRHFVGALVLVLVFAVVLYVQVTLFQLLDDILRNRVPIARVLELYVAWMPEILSYVLPISVLVATVIGFSLLTRSNEVTAMLVSGRSRHRMAVPVLCAGLALSAVDSWIFHHWLPEASARYDVLYDQIQGLPDRPPTNRARWTYDEMARRLYHFAAYDAARETFYRLSAFDMDTGFTPLGHSFGARAVWSGDSNLVLSDGWRRDFTDVGAGTAVGYTALGSGAGMSFPVSRAAFTRQIKKPRHLSGDELRHFTSTSARLPGPEARELRIELNARRAYPLQVLVMMLLGLPFAFAIGRRGSLYGVGVSIAVAAVYFTTVVVASHLAQLGLVTPGLAAWSPNVLFGAVGLTAFLGLRT